MRAAVRLFAVACLLAIASGCSAGYLDAVYTPSVPSSDRSDRFELLQGAHIGVVPFFDTRWLAQRSGYDDAPTVVGTIDARPVQLIQDGRVALVAEFVHASFLAELAAAGPEVRDLAGTSRAALSDGAAIAKLAEGEGLDYLVFGDIVAFDYTVVDRGPGSLRAADAAVRVHVFDIDDRRLLVRELVEASWRASAHDAAGPSPSNTESVSRRLVDYALRGALASAVRAVTDAVLRDRGALASDDPRAVESVPEPRSGAAEIRVKVGEPPAAQGLDRDVAPSGASGELPPAGSSVAGSALGSSDGAMLVPLPNEPGVLRVLSRPEGALVAIDDQLVGKTPLEFAGVEPGGATKIGVWAEGYRAVTRTVVLPPDVGVELRATLEALSR